MALKLSRRTFLAGAGATLGLPLLEIMRPAAKLQAAIPGSSPHPTRMAFVFVPNGVIVPAWKPTGAGTDYQLSETLSVLEPHKQDLIVLSGLAQDNGRPKGDGAGDHARSASTFLTGAHPVKTSGANISVGISVDQAAAQDVGFLTRLPSLELGIERGKNAGNCDSGYSCAYSANVSWKSATTPTAKEVVPRLAFERLFGTGDDQNMQKRLQERKSILDVVQADRDRLLKRLGRTDQRKLDEYFSCVREIEQRIERFESAPRITPPEMDLPEGVPDDLETHIHLMFDLLAVAFQTDTTRISTFMLANAGSNRSYSMVGVNDGHHNLSHHENKQDVMDKIKKIDQFLVSQYGYFLEKLKSIPEGEGNLLDNSMIVYGSGLSDGNRHNHDDLPILMAGRGGGTITPGRHIKYDVETPMNNLFLSMMDRVGAKIDSIGDSTRRLSELA